MHLDAQEIVVRTVLGERADDFSGTKADFKTTSRVAAENGFEIQSFRSQLDAIARPEFAERPFLGRSGTAGAQDKAANVTLVEHSRKFCLIRCKHAQNSPGCAGNDLWVATLRPRLASPSLAGIDRAGLGAVGVRGFA